MYHIKRNFFKIKKEGFPDSSPGYTIPLPRRGWGGKQCPIFTGKKAETYSYVVMQRWIRLHCELMEQ